MSFCFLFSVRLFRLPNDVKTVDVVMYVLETQKKRKKDASLFVSLAINKCEIRFIFIVMYVSDTCASLCGSDSISVSHVFFFFFSFLFLYLYHDIVNLKIESIIQWQFYINYRISHYHR